MAAHPDTLRARYAANSLSVDSARSQAAHAAASQRIVGRDVV
jgi:hypothetical protein